MIDTHRDTLATSLLSALADLLMEAGCDRTADAIHTVIEAPPAFRHDFEPMHHTRDPRTGIEDNVSNWRKFREP